MLNESPWAFGSSPSEDRGLDPAGVQRSLAEEGYALVGVLDRSEVRARLLAVAGIRREDRLKRRHAATMFSVYTTPSARGRGFGRLVVAEGVRVAREWPGVRQVELCVSARAAAALSLYGSLGFRAWGVQPAALTVDGEEIDETHMTLRL